MPSCRCNQCKRNHCRPRHCRPVRKCCCCRCKGPAGRQGPPGPPGPPGEGVDELLEAIDPALNEALGLGHPLVSGTN